MVIVEMKGEKFLVPDCVTRGTYLDGVDGLVPWCARDGCESWDRCLSGGRLGKGEPLEREGGGN